MPTAAMSIDFASTSSLTPTSTPLSSPPSRSTVLENVTNLAFSRLCSDSGTEEEFSATINNVVTTSATSTNTLEDIRASLSAITSELAKCRRALGPNHVARRLVVERALGTVFDHIYQLELPLDQELDLLISTTKSLLQSCRVSGALPAQSFSWLFRNIVFFMGVVRPYRQSHGLMSQVLNRLLSRRWKDVDNVFDDFLYNISSSYVEELEGALSGVVSSLESRGIPREALGCGCRRCNSEAEAIAYDFGTQEEKDDQVRDESVHVAASVNTVIVQRERLAEILAGRTAFFAVLDRLSPQRSTDISQQLLKCPSLTRRGQLLRLHHERSSQQLDALISQRVTVTSAPQPSPPSLPLPTTQKSDAAVQTITIREFVVPLPLPLPNPQPTRNGSLKRALDPDAPQGGPARGSGMPEGHTVEAKRQRREAKEESLSVGDNDQDNDNDSMGGTGQPDLSCSRSRRRC
ncbi:hypothetical protein SISSUDRAFT_469327 [Sistotremastrum suecicum HHB10207 ss-3]|uniref:Uncharacterized protein n=1 Tax=Sistotremastrum suecicum HHB10207 ss-3 TaxID=1314776 RepID=A0A165Y5V0_9AGAM|nr:hypothetical protein SISSUDRAFT_469327 [Sistotremastrum suecicum HHB10207 ss-3]